MKTKVITTLMIVLFLASMLSLTKPVIAPPPPGMISYWRLDEGSGTIAYDSVGTNDGSVTNPNWSLYGMVGGCIQSSPHGSTYARVSNSLSLNVPGDQLTVEAWVYLFGSSYLEGQGNAGYVAAKDISEGYLSYGLLVGGWWRGLFQFTVETIENGWRYVDSTIDFPAGTWFHMVGVYDGSQLRLYVNGVLNNVAAQSGTIASGPGPFWIGKYPGLNGYDWAYYGKIDEVAIYNRALSAEEIRQHYENGLKGLGYYIPNQPPVADAGTDQTVEQNRYGGADVTLDGFGSTDDGQLQPLTYTWTWSEGSAAGVNPTVTLPLGTTTVTITVYDGQYTDTDTVVITVQDTTPPTISVTVTPKTLWPPNHKYVDVTAILTVSDICDPSPEVTLVSVTSNEPDDARGIGDGNTINDIVIVDTYCFKLRAERDGAGTGRVYTIIYRVTDESGNSAIASAAVIVPHARQ